MTSAIEARGLVKAYSGNVRALDGLRFEVEAGTIFGLLGPNGAGKSTTVKILTTLSRPDEGEARVAGHRRRCATRPRAPRDRRRRPARRASTRRPPAARTSCCRARSTACAARQLRRARRRAARPLRPGRGRRPPGPHVLGRHAAAARHRDRARPPAAGALPRRADHRPGPRGARGDVGRDRAARRRGGPDDPAHDALPGGGGPARRRARDRRPRPGRRRGHARGAQGASCAATRSRSSWATPRGQRPRAARRSAASTACTRSSSTGARCALASTTAPRAVPAVLAALESAGVAVATVTVARPSLDDVYLRYAGRALRDADTRGGPR